MRAAAKTPAKTRTLVRATNDKNMFISGHKPAPKRLVSSSAGRRSTPKAPPSAPPRQPVKTSLDMPSEAPRPPPPQPPPPRPTHPPPIVPPARLAPARRDWAVMSAFEREVHAK